VTSKALECVKSDSLDLMCGKNKKKQVIDILIEFDKEKTTFDNFMGVCFYLDNLFRGEKVEVVTIGGLSKYIGPYILKEVEYVG
jgi:predicted nucleotidyltransferase